jgi:hypothetical protein
VGASAMAAWAEGTKPTQDKARKAGFFHSVDIDSLSMTDIRAARVRFAFVTPV